MKLEAWLATRKPLVSTTCLSLHSNRLLQLEDAAVAAREAATLDLLRELELEEAAKKVGEGGRQQLDRNMHGKLRHNPSVVDV